MNYFRYFQPLPCKQARRRHPHDLMHFQFFPHGLSPRGAGPAQMLAPTDHKRNIRFLWTNVFGFFKNFFKRINSSTYPVRAFKENSVVCDRHYSSQCSNEWTEVGDIFSCTLKQKIMQPYHVKLFLCGGHLTLPALHHRQVLRLEL